jgi:fructokinase
VKHESIPTSTPEETLRAVASTLVSWKVQTLGIGSFGPVCLNKSLPEWGYITTTPKPKWAQTDVVGLIRKYMVEAALEKDDDGFDWKSYYTSMPIAFNTDVNTAALAEMQYGDHGSVSSCAYITIGTGIGVGIVSGANLVTNMLHPEAGHVLVRKHEADKVCSY